MALPTAGPPPRRVPAVDRAARLLDLLEAGRRPQTISELARQLGVNKGTVRDLLETLRAHRLLERDEAGKQYRLGPRLARLGLAALGQIDLPRAAHPHLLDLAAETGGAVLLVVPQADRATIVDKVDAGRVAVQVSATVGRRIPLAAGACGKVFLGWLVPPSAWPAHLARLAQLTPGTERTVRDPERYREAVEQARRLGYATDDQEYLPGVRATAAPVFDARGQLLAAVLVVGLTVSLQADDLEAIGRATARAARRISDAIGAA